MKTSDIVAIVLIIISLIFLVLILKETRSDGYKCISEPLIYSATMLEELNRANVSCTCVLDKPGSPVLQFDSKGKRTLP